MKKDIEDLKVQKKKGKRKRDHAQRLCTLGLSI